jgi:hypothetical protein
LRIVAERIVDVQVPARGESSSPESPPAAEKPTSALTGGNCWVSSDC